MLVSLSALIFKITNHASFRPQYGKGDNPASGSFRACGDSTVLCCHRVWQGPGHLESLRNVALVFILSMTSF